MMTIIPVYKFISTQLETAVSVYNKDGSLQLSFRKHDNHPDLLSCFPELRNYFWEQTEEIFPRFSFFDDSVCCVHFPIENGIVVIGPFHILFSGDNADARYRFPLNQATLSIFSPIPDVIALYTMQYVLLLFNCIWETSLSVSDCYGKNFHTNQFRQFANQQTVSDIFLNRENQKGHNSYAKEMRMLEFVETGNVEALRESWKEDPSTNLGTTAKDPVRNGKNMAIYTVTACGRAAIRGGISSEYVFTLTDSYSQQIEDLTNTLLLQSLVEDAELQFAQLVAASKKHVHQEDFSEPPIIQQCKDYIFKNLHSPLTVKEIADALHIHPNYLGSLFHTSEGQPLYKYIIEQKITAVQNLLTYSNYSYLEIAHYLGFSSQSHLGNHFKASTGMTLKQYRETHKPKDFYE